MKPEQEPQQDNDNPFNERQMEVLRERHSQEKARYETVVENARLNQAMEESLHQLACMLLEKARWGKPNLSEMLKRFFNLDDIRLCLRGDGDLSSEDFDLLMERVSHGGSICDDRVSTTLVAALFGEDSAVKSCAFIPLSTPDRKGVLVMGSIEAERFEAGIGVMYLDRIGAFISAILSRPAD